ncbi:MAG: HNH endonuclease [Candidatus Pacebacteria bacterium]|nr:HNH endonuclease [Candidatus Paceibacterota bacterium]
MQFEFPEDKKFFAGILAEGDEDLLDVEYSDLFDFRHPAIKRWEFDKVSKKVLRELTEKHKSECQLRIHHECSNDDGFEPDHIIPLSSNVLNKELRHMKPEKGMKVVAQSFGSNNPRNLTLACRKCNRLKKHRILSGGILEKLLVGDVSFVDKERVRLLSLH